MSVDLMGLIRGAVGKEVLGPLSGVLGTDEETTSRAFEGALPAILGGVIQKASTPRGAEDIFREVEQQDDSILGSLPDILSGGGGDLISRGTGLLSTIFGSKLAMLLPLLAKLFGLDKGKIGTLLGVVGPIIMSVLSKQKAASGFDAAGLASMLESNREQVDRAMPAEIKQELGFSQSTPSARPAASDSGSPSWLYPLLAAAVVGFLAWTFWPKGDIDAPEMPGIDGVEMPTVESLSTKATDSLSELTAAISGIDSEASATSALDKINAARETFNNLGVDKLPEAAQSKFGGIVQPLLEKLKSALEAAYAIPGVQAILEPKIGPLMETLEGFAG